MIEFSERERRIILELLSFSLLVHSFIEDWPRRGVLGHPQIPAERMNSIHE